MDVFDAIKNRRSVRNYADEPIDEALINDILDAGRWAPSWSNTQCWRFLVIKDKTIKDTIAGTLNSIQLPDRVVENPGAKAVRAAPVLITVCAGLGIAGGKPGGTNDEVEYITDKGDWYMFDAALAVQNMSLAAHARGFGSVIIGAFDATAVEKYLNIPDCFRVVVLLPIGIPVKLSNPPPRKELAEITCHETWQF